MLRSKLAYAIQNGGGYDLDASPDISKEKECMNTPEEDSSSDSIQIPCLTEMECDEMPANELKLVLLQASSQNEGLSPVEKLLAKNVDKAINVSEFNLAKDQDSEIDDYCFDEFEAV